MEEAWTANHEVGRSSPSRAKLIKSLQQASNLKIAGSFGSRPKLGGPGYHCITVGHVKNPPLPFTHGASVRLPGAVSPDVLRFKFLRITLAVPEVVGIENWVTSNIPFLLDSSSIAKMQS